jgi:hypothetical protein
MNMFKRFYLQSVLVISSCAAMAAVPSHADTARELLCTQAYAESMRTQSMFAKIDADHDGKVTHDEVVAYFGTVFDTLDIDHDGVLDDREWFGARSSAPVVDFSSIGYAQQLATEQMLQIMDHKNKKVVTKNDFVVQHERIFKAMTSGHNEPLDSDHWLATHFPR